MTDFIYKMDKMEDSDGSAEGSLSPSMNKRLVLCILRKQRGDLTGNLLVWMLGYVLMPRLRSYTKCLSMRYSPRKLLRHVKR
jgi:hypothetical protein